MATATEIARGLEKTVRWVNKSATIANWPHRVINARGDREFFVEKLPEDVRIAVAAARIGAAMKPAPRPSYNIDAPRIPVGAPDLSDRQNRVALARADLIRQYVAVKEKAREKNESVLRAAELFVKGYNTGHLLPQVFEALGPTSWKSVERWLKDYRSEDYDYSALATRWGANKGQRKVTDEEMNTLLSFALHPNRLRISESVRLTKLALDKRGVGSLSHEATLRRALNDWIKTNYDRWVFCREGEKALNDKCLPYLERDPGLLSVGDVLVADGHTLNFRILHPMTGKPCRMTMIAWYDWASCMPAGWEIMPTENVQAVAAGLRRGIIALGKTPKVAYLDNGKAFKAKIFTDETIDFEQAGFYGMFARLGVETVFAWPYNAQSKPVERFFETFSELERLMPTFTGTCIDDKPAHLARNERLHKQIHEKRYGGWVPTVEEANRIIEGWVKEYSKRPHRGLKGLCPGDVFDVGRGPGVDESALRHLMMSMEVKSVQRNGIFFMGRYYYEESLYGYRDRVLIRYDLEDLSRIEVYDHTGTRLICEATPLEKVHPMAVLGQPEDMALVKDGIKRKRALKRTTERAARAYIAGAPRLVELPQAHGAWPTAHGKEEKARPLPQAEAERIEAEASRMKVLELVPRTTTPIYLSEPERYETLLEEECKGEELAVDDLAFLRYFETTQLYASLKDRFQFLRELWLVPESIEQGAES